MKYINKFLKHLKNQNFSAYTIRDYLYILSEFEKYLNKIKVFDEKDVSESHFNNYISKHKNSNKYSFYYIIVTKIKKYFRFLQEFNFIFISPIEKIKNPKQVIRHHPIIQRNDLIDILNKYKGNSFGIRTRAILEILYSSALRPGECLNLDISNIDFNNKLILVKKTKTKTDRIVPVTSEALYWINEYLNKVRNKINTHDNKIFLSFRSKNQLTTRALTKSLRYSFNKKQIKHFPTYSFRATSATHLFENGMSITHLQLLLGHKDLRATHIYVRVSFIKLKEILDKFHPRNKLDNKRIEENEISEIC